jgi:hypothetical protein
VTEEFRRLLDNAPDAELRAVLQSAERDQPSPRALTQAARTLGIGAAGLGLARAAAAAAGSRALRTGPWAALAKWGGAGIVLGGIALSPLVLNTRASSLANVTQRSPHSGNSTVNPRAASPQPNADAVATLSTAPVRSAVDTTSAHSTSAHSIAPAVPAAASASLPLAAVRLGAAPAGSPARAASEPVPRAAAQLPPPTAHSFAAAPSEASDASAPASAAHPHLLDNEIALLDSARAALKRGDSAAALTALDRHAQLAARSLGAEATLLRVQTLLLAGRPSEARAVARAALTGKKDLPYAARLRNLAGLTE